MPLNSCASTLAALLVAFATPATASSADASDLSPAYEYDNVRGSGLPHCECDAYHNRAFPWMSRMCEQPFEEEERVVCYPTRVGHPGTVLNGRFYVNNCNDGQTMCSPWTRPEPEPEPGTQIQVTLPIRMGMETDNENVAFYEAALRRALGPLKDALAGIYGEFVSADMIQIGVTNVVASVLPFAQNNPDATAILLVTVTAPDEVAQAVVTAIAFRLPRDYKDLSTDSAITAIVQPFGIGDPSGITITVDGVPL